MVLLARPASLLSSRVTNSRCTALESRSVVFSFQRKAEFPNTTKPSSRDATLPEPNGRVIAAALARSHRLPWRPACPPFRHLAPFWLEAYALHKPFVSTALCRVALLLLPSTLLHACKRGLIRVATVITVSVQLACGCRHGPGHIRPKPYQEVGRTGRQHGK
jgi:hypothetical protein